MQAPTAPQSLAMALAPWRASAMHVQAQFSDAPGTGALVVGTVKVPPPGASIYPALQQRCGTAWGRL